MYKDAKGVYHSHDPKLEAATEEMKQKAAHYASLGMNVPLAMAADVTSCLSAIPKTISADYLEKAKTLGPVKTT